MAETNGSARKSRRAFLKASAVGVGAAGLAAAHPFGIIRRAHAAGTLKIVMWSHFVPEYDVWFDEFANGWGADNGVTVEVDHIPHLELPARAAAEVSAQSGHDLFHFAGSGGPHLYVNHLADLTDLINEFQQKYGETNRIGRQIAYFPESDTWSAFPDYYIAFPGQYRKDLWDEIGMTPDTWDDVRVGGAKLKATGHPVGIGLAHHVDANASWRGVLWSFGAAVQDESGTQVVLNSKEAVEAVKFGRALFKEAMTPEVLSWDDSSNNRFLASTKGSFIHNPISAYRSIQKTNEELADKIFIWQTPKGPAQQLAAVSPNSYGIWQFSQNQDLAKEFLRYYAANWVEAFKASTGYNQPIFSEIVPKPMPILSNDPTSNPPDKLSLLQDAGNWSAAYGYPGPGNPAAEEVVNQYIIPDMVAHAATDDMTPEEAVAWADKAIRQIYEKWKM